MKNFKTLCFILLIVVCNMQCTVVESHNTKSSGTEKQTRSVSEFNSISLSVPAHIYLVQGGPQLVILEGSKEDLDQITTKVKGSTLQIENDDKLFSRLGEIKIYITLANLNSLEIAGSGAITAEQNFVCKDLKLEIAGSGKMEFSKLSATSVHSDISGSGSINMKGDSTELNNQKISIAGSGEVIAENMRTADVKISISGSGSCNVFALKNLDVDIAGSGSVYYKGTASVNSDIAGSGKIKKVD
jgi:hypothetical protein